MNSKQITDMARAINTLDNYFVANNCMPLTRDQLACLTYIDRHTEAWGMLEDFEARIGVPAVVLRPLFVALQGRLGDALYAREFPDYGALDFRVPQGFEDCSWKNDACPSWQANGFKLFADFAMRERREFQQHERFVLCNCSDMEGTGDVLLSSNDMNEIVAFIGAVEKYNTEQRTFIGQRVTRVKAEIVHAVACREPLAVGGKIVPDTIRSFGELHLYCDANCLGGLCEDHRGNVLFPRRTERDTILTQGFMEVMEIIQTAVHVWIANGGMLAHAKIIREEEERITRTAEFNA